MIVHASTSGDIFLGEDDEYDGWLQRLQKRFISVVDEGRMALFTTDAEGLFSTYLEAIPEEHRQYSTCHACRHFMERFGGLVTIDESGMTASALWDEHDAPELYKPAVRTIERLVRRARVTGVFYSALPVWGNPVTGPWHHLAVTPQRSMVFRRITQTPFQAMSEKREDFKQVITALQEFTPQAIDQAVTLLKTEALYRSEKCLGAAEWMATLHHERAKAKGHGRENVVWRAVAQAPSGYCHPRSSMIGSLLEDILAGLPFETVSRRFADKMHPLQYQRPQAAPSAGNIAQAEKLVEQMGIANSLRRRFARLDEVQALWRPSTPLDTPTHGGVFGHLISKQSSAHEQMRQPTITMTWEKFSRTVLPTAEQISFHVPSGRGNFAALVTAVDFDAPPILQWDRVEQRNPVSWYVYSGGSPASHWGLFAGRWQTVSAISYKPSMWSDLDGRFAHHGQSVVFILDGARDTIFNSLALFPETLKSELHAIRSTIEAYSRGKSIEGVEESSACGIALQKGMNWNALFRVTTNGQHLEYKLDRWD